MEYNSAEMPPIPVRNRRHDLRLNIDTPLAETSRRQTSSHGGKRLDVPPASPEVMANLITSLTSISEPASSHFDRPPSLRMQLGGNSLSVPATPASGATAASAGSFGVDYGAYSSPPLKNVNEHPESLDELAASPPIIRTSKPPSGFSSLTAPKSPRTPRSTSRDSGGFRSFMRSSTTSPRPSSRGSHASKNDDAQSIGNLSIERASAATPELDRRKSTDSWGKKMHRSSKGLMYMSSKERLREKDYERRRSTGAAPSGQQASSVHSGNARGDPFFAEAAIREEPHANGDTSPSVERGLDSPRAIPTRDSSLRNSSSTRNKRSSARQSKRDSEHDHTIPEGDERDKQSARKKAAQSDPDLGPRHQSFLLGPDQTSPAKTAASAGNRKTDESEDGAPFPAVSQGRRRDRSAEANSRRHSGRHSPGPQEAMSGVKRSSSRLKRLSGGLSPRTDERESTEQASGQPLPTGYERPQSADSVDDAVESYLCAPRLSQKIKHPQTGRSISFSEVGDPEGSAVFCCVGMGLTRYITAFYDELALTLKLRLITPDRPGVGDSESYSDGTATPLSWPDDVYAICQALKITKFSILAHSAGAIYALATALRMPQHIRGRIHLLAPWIPPSQMNTFGGSQATPPTNSIPTSQRILRALPTPILKAANSSFMTATSSSITSSLPKTQKRGRRKTTSTPKDMPLKDMAQPVPSKMPPMPLQDKENFAHDGFDKALPLLPHSERRFEDAPRLEREYSASNGETAILAAAASAIATKERQAAYDTRLTHAIWELATTGANPAVDLLVCLERRHTIGFRYVDISRPVVIHHGSRDTRVPVDNVVWLGKTMRRCEVRVLEGEGHGLMASAAVMGAVLMEMSKEWEDWNRATGEGSRRERERGRRAAAVAAAGR